MPVVAEFAVVTAKRQFAIGVCDHSLALRRFTTVTSAIGVLAASKSSRIMRNTK